MKSKKKLDVKKLRKLKATNYHLNSYIKEELIDDDGNANIDLYVNEDNIYTQFSGPKNQKINPDVYDYLCEEVKLIPIQYPIKFNIHYTGNIDTNNVKKQLQYKCWESASYTDKIIKRSTITAWALIIIGISLLSIYFIFNYTKLIDAFYLEFISITANFSIWEAFDYGFLNKIDLRSYYYAYSRAAIAEYAFIDENKEKMIDNKPQN